LVCKTLFSHTICETSWIIFTKLPRKSKTPSPPPMGLTIAHFGVQGNESKSAAIKSTKKNRKWCALKKPDSKRLFQFKKSFM